MSCISNSRMHCICWIAISAIVLCCVSCKKGNQEDYPYFLLKEKAGIAVPDNSNLLYFKYEDSLQASFAYIRIEMDTADWQEMVQSPPFSGIEMIRFPDNMFTDDKFQDDGWEPQAISNSISGILNTEAGGYLKYLFDDTAADHVDTYFFLGFE